MEEGEKDLDKASGVILVRPGGIETRFPTFEEATAAGEEFLLAHPSECSVALYELDEVGREARTRKIFHWRDDFFHYLDAAGGGRVVAKVFRRPCRRPTEAGESGPGLRTAD